MNHNPLNKYHECSVCNKIRSKSLMAYIKLDTERDYFPEIGHICGKCSWKVLDELLIGFGISSENRNNPKWVKKNIGSIAENFPHLNYRVEKILFICGVIIHND